MNLAKGFTRYNYKTDEDYLKDIYKQNKAFIDKSLKSAGYQGYKDFEAIIKGEQLESGLGIVGAVKKASARETFTPYAERAKQNMYIGLKGDMKAFDAVRKATGWHDKFDASKMQYDKTLDGYIYKGSKGTVLIEVVYVKKSGGNGIRVTKI